MKIIMPLDRKLLVAFLLLFSVLGFSQNSSRTENAQKMKVDSLLLQGAQAMDQANFVEAVTKLKKAESLSEEFQNKSNIALSNQLLAKVYFELGETDFAVNHILNAIKLHQELQELNYLGKAYLVYTQILIKSGNSEKALPFLDNAEIIFSNTRDDDSRILLATTYLYE